MGSISNLLIQDSEKITISRVTGFGASGEFKVSVNGVIRRVNSAISETIAVGDTVLLNKTPYGKYYISGITSGLGDSAKYMEVVKDG